MADNRFPVKVDLGSGVKRFSPMGAKGIKPGGPATGGGERVGKDQTPGTGRFNPKTGKSGGPSLARSTRLGDTGVDGNASTKP